MQYNAMNAIQAFGAGRDMRTNMNVGNALAEGNTQGAERAAFQGGQVDRGLQLQQGRQQQQATLREQMARMNEQERAAAMQRAEGLAQLGSNLMRLPYEQRRQVVSSPMFAQQAQAIGLQPSQLAQFDPTDENIMAAAAPLMDLAQERDVPTSIREFQEFSRMNPNQQQAFNQFRTAGRTPPATVNVNNGGATQDPFQNTLAETEAQVFSGFFEQGQMAARNLRQLGRLEQLIQSSPSGAEGAIKLFAGEYGIETEGLSDIQAANALISSMVPDQRPPGSGVMSDADLALFKASLPRIINTPEGNRLIIETLRGINEYDLQLGQIAQQAAAGDITRQQARERVNALQNPIDAFRDQIGRGNGNDGRSDGQRPAPFRADGYADGTMIQGPDGTRYRVRNGMAEPQ